ncbi:hypothetical protein [Candidatus Uabimicrobium sp. HlEnr_7]|uniref:hypothetical protein n=1 Tax=Candidatus Uabimicrobium helgolandensis TaxID=3095367 RepID=UPI003556CD03
MNNLQNNIKKLRIAVYALIIISAINLVILLTRPPQKQETEVLWQGNLQTKIQELESNLQLLDKKISNLQQELPRSVDYTNVLEDSMQNSISLILANIEEKKNKFKHLSKKITDLSNDISTLKKRFSSMETENK